MKNSYKSKQGSSNEEKNNFFVTSILYWYEKNKRFYPWIGEKDPYKVWLSEIILQQTRVEQGLPYYLHILEKYPTVAELAGADEQSVFRLWQGLGYYNRCKNMLKTARIIHTDFNDRFPETYEELLRLPGIGPYTAAAISSFAFAQPHAVVDGNVERVLARYYGKEVAVNSSAGKKSFSKLANTLLYKKDPAAYNQAIMDFGATVCLPRNPACEICPLRTICVAYNENKIALLPVKKAKKPVRERFLFYYVVRYETNILLKKRGGGDIWENLYDFPLVETGKELLPKGKFGNWVLDFLKDRQIFFTKGEEKKMSHLLSHQKLHIRFIPLQIAEKVTPEGFEWIPVKSLDAYPLPRPLVKYSEKYLNK